MDLITIILIIAGVLAASCIVGIVRNWNNSTDSAIASGPLIHLTFVGWILAIFAVGVVITSIILAWQAGWLPPMLLRGLGQKGILVLGVIAGLLCFFVPAQLLHALGVRVWRTENQMGSEASPDKHKPKQLRFRLDEKPPEDQH